MNKENKQKLNENDNLNNIYKDNDDNIGNYLNSSNEIDRNEDNLKRTLISPNLSPEDINLFDNDNFSKINSAEEENINYNPNRYISPTMQNKNYKTISKMDKIIIEYNNIKSNFNKILSFKPEENKNEYLNDEKRKDKYLKKLSDYNLSMLNHLSELSNLLNKIVDNQNIYANKNLMYNSLDIKPKTILLTNESKLDNLEKMLHLNKKQYNKINERLTKIKNEKYINELKSKINGINQEISIYEQENRNLHKNQLIQENLLKNSNGKNLENMENNLKKKIEICDKFENEYMKASKKIEKDKEYIKSNEQKINILNEKCNNLTQMAKDLYDIEYFESIDKIKKRSKEKKLKIERKTKEYEVNLHSMKSNLNKLKIMLEQNKKDIQLMENENNILIEKYQKKQYELELCSKKLKDYQNINLNGSNEKINLSNKNKNDDIKPKKRKLNIKLESFNNKNNINNKGDKINENKPIKINNNPNINNENVYNEIYNNSIKNRKKNNMALLLSSGPSLISLTKEKSNFGDINDIQLLNSSNNGKNENNNIDSNEENQKIYELEKENNNRVNNEIKNKNMNKINNDVININIINEQNNNKESENKIKNNSLDIKKNEEKNNKYLSPLKINTENNQEKTINVLNRINANSLSKEMIIKGLDEQEKENNTLVYSSRYINNKGSIDRRKFLKLNFSFVSAKKDNKLNMSLHTLPNERKLLNDDEIEEDIITDNSADNINKKESKVKNFLIEEIDKDKDKNINNDNNLNINNNSIAIDKNILSEYKKPNSNENKDNNVIEDIIENNNENENKNKNSDKNKRENALNTILYNVNENNQILGETKNDKISKDKNKDNIDNNINGKEEEEQINKSFEEEHIFDKKKETKKEENDSANYDFDEGDNIIDIDYDKI